MSDRRSFLKQTTLLGGAATLGTLPATRAQASAPKPQPNPLPRWRGFNLMAFFHAFSENSDYGNRRLRHQDLDWIRDWGFDYIRLPFDYWFFVDSDWRRTRSLTAEDIYKTDEASLEMLDTAIKQCLQRGLHVTVNMHRAPGYCINDWEREPFNLWKDSAAEDAFAFLWNMLAKRYEGLPNKDLSFNLVNEAPNINERMSREDYRRVMLRGRDAIHSVTPDRTVIIDGVRVGRDVVYNMIDENVAQAFHAYDPHPLTHYKASWVGYNTERVVPAWPYPRGDGSFVDRRDLAVEMAPWAELARQCVGVHCGEFGCYRYTAHDVVLAWLEDVCDLLKQNHIGYALWNFRGDFGILDSNRKDVEYVDWYGHKLDRQMLDILQRY